MSGWSLNFDERFDYPHDKQGINLSVKISKESMLPVSVQAKLDTGSTFCIFQTHYAQMLGLELEKGDVELVRTATGKFIAHGHEVTLNVGNLEWEATVYFAADEFFPINVLGRIGFLDRLKIGLVDYEQLLYLTSYNE